MMRAGKKVGLVGAPSSPIGPVLAHWGVGSMGEMGPGDGVKTRRKFRRALVRGYTQ